MSNIAKRLDVHFAALATIGAVAGIGATAQNADAAVVYSGVVNLPIASSTNGLYLNVITGAINEPGNTGGSSVPGWDINPWSSSGLAYFNPGAPSGGVYVQNGAGATANLPVGTLIDAASLYGAGGASTAGVMAHVLNSADNIIGFRFQNEANANAIHFGWFRVSLAGTLAGQPRTLVEYAYESQAGVGINAGIPAPSAGMGLLALGAAGLLGRRRK
jgi:MYXO-CTERM domain-containing protein